MSIFAFSKRIKDYQVDHQEITDAADIAKIQQVIEKLEKLPRVSKSDLSDLDLRTNPKKWAISLTTNFPSSVNKENMADLISDFTDAMRTRMREESKYAIGLLMQSGLILCHSSYGEETITPEWKIIPRMLDTDNVLRYVYFINEKGTMKIEYWEREATSSFIEWLNLPHKAAFLFGGRYRLISNIEGVNTEFQLSDSEMETWISKHPEFREGTIKLANPVERLNISEIRTGRKSYDNVQDFIQDYDAEKYGIARYQQEYERINSKALPLLVKYYDEKTRLVRKEGDEEVNEITKTTPSFDILFVNEYIVFRASYLKDIITRFINGDVVKVFHAGGKFKTTPLTIGCMEIYNRLKTDIVIEQITKYLKDTSIQDKNLNVIMQYVILRRLAEVNKESPLIHFLQPLFQGIIDSLVLDKKWAKLEDEILEYKSGEFIVGRNDEVIKRIGSDLSKKLEKSSCKVYLIGVEDDGTVRPVPVSRLKSDRIETLRKGLKNELKVNDVDIFVVRQNEEAIVLLIARRE